MHDVSVNINKYLNIYIYIFIHIHTFIYIYIYICTHARRILEMYRHTHIYIYIISRKFKFFQSLEVLHGEAAHGSSIEVPCPSGYNGTVTLACRDHSFTLNRGKCGARCAEGSLNYHLPGEDTPYVVPYPEMDDREDVISECPSPLVGTIRFKCQDGAVLAREKQCRQALPCPAGDFVLDHAKVYHSAMDHGIMEPSSCPDGFEGD